MLTDQCKTDVRRFCGYPAYGAAPEGNMGWRFFTAYGALEYRMNNLSPDEEAVVYASVATLRQLEQAVPCASDNLDSDGAASWTHNRNEVADRLRLLDSWQRRLCAFLGVPPGEGLAQPGLNWVV
jgi:hypothetical protein